MSVLTSIIEPTLLLDREKCQRNIQKMVEKAQSNGIRLRPHFKTHQSKEVGEWFQKAGVRSITVSSLQMATYFAEQGWDDITVAFPVNVLEIERINRLANRIQLNLIVVGLAPLAVLAAQLHASVNLWIKIDVGYHRTGVSPDDEESIAAILHYIQTQQHLHFKGFLAHAGHSYNCRSHAEILSIHRESTQLLTQVAARYRPAYPDLEISAGDTPTCSVAEDFSMVTEIRPGNFVFYDLTQARISSCTKAEIAVAMACPVVAKHPERQEIIVYGGGVHFAKDVLEGGPAPKSYGELVYLEGQTWSAPVPDCYLSKISQEHGTLKVNPTVFQQIEVGEVVLILPVHSCMTANAMRRYTTLQGERLEYLDSHQEYFIA